MRCSTDADEKAVALIQAIADDAVKTTDTAVYLIKDGKAYDPVSGAEVVLPPDAEDVINSNVLRRELDVALAAIKLFSPDTNVRAAAVKTLQGEADVSKLPLVEKALATEKVPAIKEALSSVRAALLIASPEKGKRMAAALTLGSSGTPAVKTLLIERLNVETDPDVRKQLELALQAIEGRLVWGERLGVRVHRRQPRLDPAAGRARPCHHLRPDGRHQHGARRADDDRRLRDLRGAEPVPRAPARRRSTGTCSRPCRCPSSSPRWSARCSSAA